MLWLPYWSKNPQSSPFSLRYKEKGKLLLQSVLCATKPEKLVLQMEREEYRNLQDEIVTSKLPVLACVIIYSQNFWHVLQEITTSMQLKGREDIWGAAQNTVLQGKPREARQWIEALWWTIYIWLLSLPVLGRTYFFHLFSFMLSEYVSKCCLAICSCQIVI